MTPFEHIAKTLLRPWVAVSYFCLVGLFFLYFDPLLAVFFHEKTLGETWPFIQWLTHLGIGEIYVVGLFLLALFYRYIRPNKTGEVRSWFLWLCVIIPYFICGILKVMLGRARPELLFDHQLYGFYGFHLDSHYWSFPSGHTSTIIGLVLGLTIVFPKYCYAFFFSGLLLIATRVLLTSHYLSDVLTTGYLTFLEVFLLMYFLRKKDWLRAAYTPTKALGT